MNYFTPKTELSVNRYDCLIKLYSSLVFMTSFQKIYIKMCYNLSYGMSKLAEIWNLG
jgi:predicted DNA-binding protein YlxM (UPF0122 family)